MKGGRVTVQDGRTPLERIARNRVFLMLGRLEEYLTTEYRAAKLPKQLQRFLLAFTASLTATAGADGWQLSWGVLWALLPPSVWVGVEAAWPTIDWRTVQQYIDSVRTENAATPLTPPAAPGHSPPQENPPAPPAAHP